MLQLHFFDRNDIHTPKPISTKVVNHLPLNIYNSLTWMGASKTKMILLSNGDYKLQTTSGIQYLIFLFFQLIFWVKTLHLVGILVGISGIDISEFYDTIAVLTWFLILTGCGVAYWGLVRTYPFFELLKEGFRIQNRIFRMFQQSDSQDFQGKVTYAGKWVVARQTEVLIVCLISITIQFISAPKYLTNIYILLPWDDDISFWMMYTFELICMFLIVILWNCALSGLPLSAIYLEQTLRLMGTKIVQELMDSDPMRASSSSTTHSDIHMRNKPGSSGGQSANVKIVRRSMYHEYSVFQAVKDYRELVLFSERLNEFQKYKVLGIHVVLYGQQTAEAFTAFRMLRTEGIALGDFAFLLTDMWTAIRQLFLNFKGISFVGEAAEGFLHGLKLRVNMMTHEDMKYYQRVLRSFQPIYVKQGPNLCKKNLLGCAWMIMMNYYVTAALWP